MANVNVQINNLGWTQIAAATSSGTYQLLGGHKAYTKVSASDPGASVLTGFTYNTAQGDTFENTVGIWARLPHIGGNALGSFEVNT